MLFTEVMPLAVDESVIAAQRQYDRELYQKLDQDRAYSDAPKLIGHLANLGTFSDYQQIMSPTEDWRTEVTIKRKDDRVVFGTPEWTAPFTDVIGTIMAYECGNFPWAEYVETTLTVDKRPVAANSMQRTGGRGIQPQSAHRDGNRGDWMHLYMVTNTLPTEFFITDRVLTDSHNHSVGVTMPPSVKVRYAAGDIVYANRTTFHRSPISAKPVERTFLRVTFRYDTTCLE